LPNCTRQSSTHIVGKYITKQDIEKIAIEKYRENGRGVTFEDIEREYVIKMFGETFLLQKDNFIIHNSYNNEMVTGNKD
jgi:hypothetical protein